MDLSLKKSCISFVIIVAVLFAAVLICPRKNTFQGLAFSKDHPNSRHATIKRRLLVTADDYEWSSRECSKENIYISQGQTPPLPSGIPTYTVLIQNICVPGTGGGGGGGGSCSISDIHLSCGWFSSARLINPNVFRRISYDDCLVNNGNPVNPGQTVAFQYANTYPYPLSVSTMSCYRHIPPFT